MPKKWIDKKTAQTFRVVHRAQDDPLIHDPEAPQQVLAFIENKNLVKSEEKAGSGSGSAQVISGERLKEDESTFKQQGRRENEGEAALYGIAYDDSKYDYMQHLKPIGQAPDAVFIAKKTGKEKPNRKDLLLKPEYVANNTNLTNNTTNNISLPKELLPSETTLPRNYGELGNMPDALAGFQPDMDPRLKEILEALEDEAYVEDDDNIFDELITSGQTERLGEEEEFDEYDEDGAWDEFDANAVDSFEVKDGEQEWETAFRKFKIEESRKKAYGSDDEFDDEDDEERDTVGSLRAAPVNNNKGRRRVGGAKTDLSGVSMTSSAMFRNEGLTLLDNRFDKIEEEYEKEDDSAEEEQEQFDMKKERGDLEDILDDFLDNYVVEGKHLYKK